MHHDRYLAVTSAVVTWAWFTKTLPVEVKVSFKVFEELKG
jgi:hypothetical protein